MKTNRMLCAACVGVALSTLTACIEGGRVDQASRDLPAYSEGKIEVGAVSLAVCPDPILGEALAVRLKALGADLVSPCPTTGARRPDLLVESLRCAQNTESAGNDVDLVTVAVVRVRKAGRLSEDGLSIGGMSGARSFQAVSRFRLGARALNDERITEDERKRGVDRALDELFKTDGFRRALTGVR